MPSGQERRLLQVTVAVLALVPIGAGLAGIILGPDFAGPAAAHISVDSYFRYLSGLLLGIGLAFWSLIPNIEWQTRPFRLLTTIVFIGGLARLTGVFTQGVPGPEMLFGLTMELIVTPLLCVWQARVANRTAQREPIARKNN